MIWIGPDCRRYLVTIYREPFDPCATVAFQRDDGWISVASTIAGRDLREIDSIELIMLLERAKGV